MTGACAGGGSGAGIRFCMAGIRGAGTPKRIVGSRTKPPRPAGPTRAKPGVEPTRQATANTAAKRRCMIAFLLLLCLPSCSLSNHPTGCDFLRIAIIGPILRSFDRAGGGSLPAVGQLPSKGSTAFRVMISCEPEDSDSDEYRDLRQPRAALSLAPGGREFALAVRKCGSRYSGKSNTRQTAGTCNSPSLL
jgi:hypothetical protein